MAVVSSTRHRLRYPREGLPARGAPRAPHSPQRGETSDNLPPLGAPCDPRSERAMDPRSDRTCPVPGARGRRGRDRIGRVLGRTRARQRRHCGGTRGAILRARCPPGDAPPPASREGAGGARVLGALRRGRSGRAVRRGGRAGALRRASCDGGGARAVATADCRGRSRVSDRGSSRRERRAAPARSRRRAGSRRRGRQRGRRTSCCDREPRASVAGDDAGTGCPVDRHSWSA